MLINASRLIGYPVLSLHLGAQVGTVSSIIVNPDDLKIIAFRCDGPNLGNGEVGDLLEVSSIREFSDIGMVIDSDDEFVSIGDVVKLDSIIELNFDLVGLKVETKKGTKLGKVSDYTVTAEDFMVMQLIVQRPALKSLLDPELVVGRSEITEVNDYAIIVRDEEQKIKKNATTKDFVPNFVNPFRAQNLEQVHREIPDGQDS